MGRAPQNSSTYGGRVIFAAGLIALFFFFYDPMFKRTIHTFNNALDSYHTLRPLVADTSRTAPYPRIRHVRSWTAPDSTIGSRSSICALALLRLAHEESLIGRSPYLASFIFSQARSVEIRVGHLRITGRARTSRCSFELPTIGPLWLPFLCSATACSYHDSTGSPFASRALHPLLIAPMVTPLAHKLMKLQYYSISTANTSLTEEQSNMYMAWMVHTARSVTDRSCLVCHDRSLTPHFMLPMGNLTECLTTPYSVDFLCPTVCLLGALSADFGPSWMYNASSSCLFHPVTTQVSTFVRVQPSLPSFFPICLCSSVGVYPVGNVSARCNVSLFANDLQIETLSVCDSPPCTPSVTIPLPDLSGGTVPLADVFWFCGGQRVRQTLPAEWQGCCAPVRLDGKTRVLLVADQPSSGRSCSRRDVAL